MSDPTAAIRTSRAPLIIVLALALGAGLALGFWLQSSRVTTADIKATVLNPPRELTGFDLVTHLGTPFNLDSLKGKWSFVFFGYTNCPDVCPTTLATLAQMDKEINRIKDAGQATQVVFVSVDPERDTPEALSQYVPYFDPAFIGVTGNPADIEALTRQLGILHMRVDEDDSKNYLVDHSASILLFNPRGQLRAHFGAPHVASEIAQDFGNLLKL